MDRESGFGMNRVGERVEERTGSEVKNVKRKTTATLLAFLSTMMVFHGAETGMAGEAGTVYPLKIGSTRRYLVDQRGTPVFINGATPWSLAAQLSREDVERYLENRTALGVNSLIVTIPEAWYADGCRDEDGPNDFYGNKPFLTRNGRGRLPCR